MLRAVAAAGLLVEVVQLVVEVVLHGGEGRGVEVHVFCEVGGADVFAGHVALGEDLQLRDFRLHVAELLGTQVEHVVIDAVDHFLVLLDLL